MGNSELSEHPIDAFFNHPQGGLPDRELSLFLARSGVGKSAAIINFALKAMLDGHHIYHFSVGMNSDKVHAYYQEVFHEYTQRFKNQNIPWQELTHNLTVVSYSSAEKLSENLAEELNTLAQHAGHPKFVFVDGLDVDDNLAHNLRTLKDATVTMQLTMVASVTIHRASDGHLDLSGAYTIAKACAARIYFMDPTKNRIRIEAITESIDNPIELPLHFSPHDMLLCPT